MASRLASQKTGDQADCDSFASVPSQLLIREFLHSRAQQAARQSGAPGTPSDLPTQVDTWLQNEKPGVTLRSLVHPPDSSDQGRQSAECTALRPGAGLYLGANIDAATPFLSAFARTQTPAEQYMNAVKSAIWKTDDGWGGVDQGIAILLAHEILACSHTSILDGTSSQDRFAESIRTQVFDGRPGSEPLVASLLSKFPRRWADEGWMKEHPSRPGGLIPVDVTAMVSMLTEQYGPAAQPYAGRVYRLLSQSSLLSPEQKVHLTQQETLPLAQQSFAAIADRLSARQSLLKEIASSCGCNVELVERCSGKWLRDVFPARWAPVVFELPIVEPSQQQIASVSCGLESLLTMTTANNLYESGMPQSSNVSAARLAETVSKEMQSRLPQLLRTQTPAVRYQEQIEHLLETSATEQLADHFEALMMMPKMMDGREHETRTRTVVAHSIASQVFGFSDDPSHRLAHLLIDELPPKLAEYGWLEEDSQTGQYRSQSFSEEEMLSRLEYSDHRLRSAIALIRKERGDGKGVESISTDGMRTE